TIAFRRELRDVKVFLTIVFIAPEFEGSLLGVGFALFTSGLFLLSKCRRSIDRTFYRFNLDLTSTSLFRFQILDICHIFNIIAFDRLSRRTIIEEFSIRTFLKFVAVDVERSILCLAHWFF
ncbi:hypothetical protein PFISCL1PPCAC_2072, partial [Pristionchus fissidentatus]